MITKWRPKGWFKNPCDGCENKQEDDYGYLCDLACGKRTAWINQEAGADAMLEALITSKYSSRCDLDKVTITLPEDISKRVGYLIFIPDDKEKE
jgi:hypothetical protein